MIQRILRRVEWIEGGRGGVRGIKMDDENVAARFVDVDARKWESKFISIGNRQYKNVNVSVYASTSLDMESSVAISSGLTLIIIGYGLLLVYIMMMLGKFSLVEHKFYVSLGGVLMVAMTCIVSVGICAIGGFVYSVLNSILPFLLLGIGVDDMFVIVQAWDNLTADEKAKPVHEKSALALKHAGVSITVTSVTDMIAFAVGATTILPGLRSFCVYCGIGICFLFIFNILFFASLLVLDARRIESKHDACICCYRHGDDYQSPECAGRYRLQEFFEGIYAKVLIKLPVKVFIVVLTAVLFGFGLWGTLKIEQKFDFLKFVPLDSYVTTFFDVREKFFPARGRHSAIYLSDVRIFEERSAITKLYADARNNTYIDPLSFSNWYEEYESWLQYSKANDSGFDESMKWPINEEIFLIWVHEFLENSTIGAQYQTDVVFDEKTSKYISSRIRFKHIVLSDSSDKVKAMDTIQNLVDEAEFRFDNDAFAFSKPYFYYETNKIIKKELWRNLGLASICVLLVILLLLANGNACVLVFFSVVLTLVDVAGFIHHWGLSIDTVVTVMLIVSIGIAVDYSAHIGHTFMTVTGTKNERTCKTLGNIGPAVFNGGFSTFLVFILLSLSNSYIYQVFFKVFLLVVMFGLFHGLVLLPVLLSWIGPSPFPEYREPTDPLSKENEKQCGNKAGVDNGVTHVEVCPPHAEYHEPTDLLSKEKEKQYDTEAGVDNVAFDGEICPPKANGEADGNVFDNQNNAETKTVR
ncbi:NPC intracellular cholesterol transporter 1-like [Anneissia japonica]|uniref:NPC intracellular cholesterol transporter 1-like n=1 Tax=Anneissia japonica TaxID=1529436 RepID=UPI001425869A|nr:NPC intracellular cholesterol transporter 1-like [Anneissia japonica]